jgi:hypothetical protein
MADLSIGATGPDVSRNQYALNRAGNSGLPQLSLDGLFGPRTQARVMEFQRHNGLTPDGIIGKLTRVKLGTDGALPGDTTPATGGGGQTENQLAHSIVIAAKAAVLQCQATVRFVGVMVNGSIATGPAGCLVGPGFSGLMAPWLAKLRGEDKAIADAASKGIGSAFDRWQKSVSVPGLLWYPSFAAFAGPVAPSMPNVPCPLIVLKSAPDELTSAASLVQAMKAATRSTSHGAEAVFAKVADELAPKFNMFLAMTMVMGVMGRGPVPSFVAPAPRAGPVVGGTVASTPGVLTGPGLVVF